MTTYNSKFGKYFEDIHLGDEFETATRTITETDIVNFAGLSGDFNPLHTDENFASQSIFKSRIAHGMLGLSVATGLVDHLGLWTGTIMAFLGLTWEFKAPIRIGDSIRVRLKVEEKRETSKPDRGILTFDVRVLNQKEEPVQEGKWKALIVRRPKGK